MLGLKQYAQAVLILVDNILDGDGQLLGHRTKNPV